MTVKIELPKTQQALVERIQNGETLFLCSSGWRIYHRSHGAEAVSRPTAKALEKKNVIERVPTEEKQSWLSRVTEYEYRLAR